MIVSRTTATCDACGARHEARYEREGRRVEFVVDCPRGTVRVPVSDDADLFLDFRSRTRVEFERPSPHGAWRHNNVIEITRACDCACPFCYSRTPEASEAAHLPVEDVVAIARRVRAEGGYAVSLGGGEPLYHPELDAIVRRIRALGLHAGILTNGLRLGRDPALAGRLKRSGVGTVTVQFDTLDPATQRLYRGRDGIPEKIAALEHCASAGLRTCAAVVVSRHNQDELGAVLDVLLPFAPNLFLVSLQCLWLPGDAPVAGFGQVDRVCKEAVVRALCGPTGVAGLSPADFWPLPAYGPFRLNIHPDCCAFTVMCRTNGAWQPVGALVDAGALFGSMAAAGAGGSGRVGAILELGRLVLRHARPGAKWALARAMGGLLRGRGAAAAVAVAIESLSSASCQDEQRTCRCGTVLRTLRGDGQNGCFANRRTGEGE